jgi:peptide chain release factor 3
VADALALDVCPMSWPVGHGRQFEGVLDFATAISRPEGDSREFLGKSRRPSCRPRIADEVELAQAAIPNSTSQPIATAT